MIVVYLKQPVLLGALLLGAAFAQAQTNFRPGYVVTLAGDTLKGEVDSRGAQRNARLSRFRTAKSAPVTEYRPQQLRGYGFTDDRVYQTETVLLSDSVRREGLPDLKEEAFPRASFLEVIVQGPASLLYLRDERSKDHYYLRTPGRPLQELIQTTQEVVRNGVTYWQKSDEFRRVLAAATQQCPAVQPAITTVRYDQAGLIRIVRAYNECVGGVSVAPAAASRKNHVRLGLVLGAERSQLVLDDYPDLQAKGTSSVQPVVGLAANLYPTGASRTLSARVEALYEKQSYRAETRLSTGTMRNYRVTLESIRLPITIRYTYPKGAVRPVVYAGYAFGLFLTNTAEVQGSYGWNPWLFANNPRDLEQGIMVGAGLTTARAAGRNLAVDLRYERSDGFLDATALGSRVNRVYLLLSYDLTK
ncbi:porin family protein [Hymenobacter luteus]